MIKIILYITRGHEDLRLFSDEISFSVEADSYYLVLDNNILPSEESYKKAGIVLREMLYSWILQLKSLGSGEIILLPLDFSDQYVGCIRIEAIDEGNVLVNYGNTTKVLGYSISPSLGQIKLNDEAFKVESDSFLTTKEELIITLENILGKTT